MILSAHAPNTAMGSKLLIRNSLQSSGLNDYSPDSGIPSFAINLSLNALLTLMIITRLILHSRNIRKAVGTTAGVTGLYKAIVTMLVESSALYAASLVLTAGPWVAGSYLQDIFTPILAEVQVRPVLHFRDAPQTSEVA